MKKSKRNLFAILLALMLTLNLFGCSAPEESAADTSASQEEIETPSPDKTPASSADSMAQRFASVWSNKWQLLTENGVMSNEKGCAFLVDMDHDNIEELVFLYEDDVNYNAVVYRLGDTIEELGSFTVSNTSPELSFSIYQGRDETTLYHIAVRTHAVKEYGTETEESFIRLEDGNIVQDGMYFTSYDGVETYYDSIIAGAKEINKEDFELLRIGMLGSSTPTQTITFTSDNFVDFSDPALLIQYLEKLFAK